MADIWSARINPLFCKSTLRKRYQNNWNWSAWVGHGDGTGGGGLLATRSEFMNWGPVDANWSHSKVRFLAWDSDTCLNYIHASLHVVLHIDLWWWFWLSRHFACHSLLPSLIAMSFCMSFTQIAFNYHVIFACRFLWRMQLPHLFPFACYCSCYIQLSRYYACHLLIQAHAVFESSIISLIIRV